jgi:small subunit ribosomal protein S20
MANHKSAIKRHRQSLRRRTHNRLAKGLIRGAVKNVQSVVIEATSGDKKEALQKARTELKLAEKLLSSAASKRIIHHRSASRKVSRLAKLVNTLQSA